MSATPFKCCEAFDKEKLITVTKDPTNTSHKKTTYLACSSCFHFYRWTKSNDRKDHDSFIQQIYYHLIDNGIIVPISNKDNISYNEENKLLTACIKHLISTEKLTL